MTTIDLVSSETAIESVDVWGDGVVVVNLYKQSLRTDRRPRGIPPHEIIPVEISNNDFARIVAQWQRTPARILANAEANEGALNGS